MAARRYPIKDKRAELEAEIKRLEAEMVILLGDMKDDVTSLKDPRQWVERHPVAIAGAGVAAGVLLTLLLSVKKKKAARRNASGANARGGDVKGAFDSSSAGASAGSVAGSSSIMGMVGSELKRILARRLLNLGSQVLEKALSDVLSGKRPA